MQQAVESDDRETVLKSIRESIVTFASPANPKCYISDICLVYISTVIEDNDEMIELVIQVCVEICPAGILACYLSTYDEISWKVASKLMKVSDLEEEKEIMNYYEQPTGIQRLSYLMKGDV